MCPKHLIRSCYLLLLHDCSLLPAATARLLVSACCYCTTAGYCLPACCCCMLLLYNCTLVLVSRHSCEAITNEPLGFEAMTFEAMVDLTFEAR